MKEMTCSFCGRSSREVSMIPGADGNICVDCVRHANEMVERHAKQANAAPDLARAPRAFHVRDGGGDGDEHHGNDHAEHHVAIYIT